MRPFIKAGIRIMIIWLFIEAFLETFRNISSYWTIIYISNTLDRWVATGFTLIPFLISVVLLAVLWWRTDWLVRFLTGGQNVNSVIVSTSNVHLVQLAVRIIGIVMVALVIPDLIGLIGYYAMITDQRDFVWLAETRATLVRQVLEVGVRLIVGIVLLLGTRGVVRAIDIVWDKVHLVNNNKKEPEQGTSE